jgi:hypothetical protein
MFPQHTNKKPPGRPEDASEGFFAGVFQAPLPEDHTDYECFISKYKSLVMVAALLRYQCPRLPRGSTILA